MVAVTADGLVSRTQEDTRLAERREAPWWMLRVNTRDTLYLVSEQGEAAGLPVHALPEVENPSQGVPIHKVTALGEGEKLAALFTLHPRKSGPRVGSF